MLHRNEKTPGRVGPGGIHKEFSQDELEPIVPARADARTLTPAESRFHDAYAVLVTGKAVRRHVYFNLPSAQRAVERAHARGADAELMLVQLKVVTGSEVIA